MYTPEVFEERDTAVLHALIATHPLGTWVAEAKGQLVVNHIPFVLDAARGSLGTLVGHVARNNTVWQVASKHIDSVVVFQGPQSYITPSWYPAKREHGKVVPTWNYAVVHAHGAVRIVEDPTWLREHLGALTSTHERERDAPWQISDAPASFIDSLLRAIVGIEIPIARLDGKWKVSQNRSVQDRRGVIEGLETSGDDQAVQMARLVERRTPDLD